MELLERASQLQALHSALNQVKAREGQGCIALVYGEAGIGKTSLVEHFIHENKKSWRILQGACYSLFTPRPLGPLHDIALQISSPKGAQGSLLALLDSESNRTIFSACLNELKEAEAMVVGVRTVETYVTRILNRLDFESRVKIATWAKDKGLV